ncbi:Transcriptional regulator [hydrothermal vent metagenome]|uniref:histidine kinase n=1 Tax=hydrothermal vent metagenome TaxID=652676 RepID=A0A1W1BXQ0_9ZZZZ
MDKTDDKIEINNLLEQLVTDIIGAERSSIWIYDNRSKLTRERRDGVRDVSLEEKKGLLYKCFATKEAAISNYLASEKGYVAHIDNPDNMKIKSKIMLPLIENNRFIGIVTAYSSVKQIKKFTIDDLELLKVISPTIIDAIQKISSPSNQVYPKVDRRKRAYDPSNTYKRRSTDTTQNLKEFKESMENSRTPQELLDYVSNIVHDIRTPSNGLFGFLEILEEKMEDHRLKQYVSHAKNSANLINELTTSILDGLSSQRKSCEAELEDVPTFKFFADIAEIFSSNMYKKQINYNIFIDPQLPKEITIESTKLKRVIMNLIGNAYKFTNENETIEFSVRYKSKDQKIHIYVKDSGIGIAEEKQEQIFEAFKQAEEDTKEKYGGTGLGLSISADYVRTMGGKLELDSELDKGSIFYFDIPIEVKNSAKKFKPIDSDNIYIVLLMDGKNSSVANHIARYLVKMGINIDNIDAVTDKKNISDAATHIIVFENKISEELLDFAKDRGYKVLAVEENFLSLDEDSIGDAKLISQYGYIAETLYAFINEKRRPRVLIVDDDKISVALIKTMLMDELCIIDVAYDGADGLRLLKEALHDNNPYRIVYLDNNLPQISGEEIIKRYRDIEMSEDVVPIRAVSISGDAYGKESKVYDSFVGKPFDKNLILSVYNDAIMV